MKCNSFFCPSESLPPTSLNHSSDFTCAVAAAVCRPSRRRVGEQLDIPWQHLPRRLSGAAAGRRIDRERAGERNSRKIIFDLESFVRRPLPLDARDACSLTLMTLAGLEKGSSLPGEGGRRITSSLNFDIHGFWFLLPHFFTM